MLKMIGSLPRSCVVACSGGVDSMAVLSFLMRGKGHVTVAYFNHGTQHSEQTQNFVEEFCSLNRLQLTVGRIQGGKAPRESWEEYWRHGRYSFLQSLSLPVLTAHHLDDCIEQWLFSSFHGNPQIIPYRNGNVIRPFLPTKKESFRAWCVDKGVPWIDDLSNQDTRYMRNHIRHNVMPQVLKVNPGIAKVIRKKVLRLEPTPRTETVDDGLNSVPMTKEVP